MIENRSMPNFKMVVGLVFSLLVFGAGFTWWAVQHHTSTTYQQLNDVAGRLVSQIQVQPELRTELLTLAHSMSPSQQLTIQIHDSSGELTLSLGHEAEHGAVLAFLNMFSTFSVQHPLMNGSILTISTSGSGLFWPWLFVVVFACSAIFAVVLHHRMLQRKLLRAWQHLSKAMQSANKSALNDQDFEDALVRLLQQHEDAERNFQRLNKELQGQLQSQVAQHQKLAQQFSEGQRRAMHLARQLQSWQLLTEQANHMNDAELRQWLSMLQWQQGCPAVPNPSLQSVSGWFAQSFRLIQQTWPQHILLLPDEEPASSRYQTSADAELLHRFMFSLLHALRPLLDGNELHLGYRVESGARDKLQIKIQFAGKNLSARSRQILAHGSDGALEWSDIAFELSYQLLQLLSADIQIQELADLGTRLVVNVPVVGQYQQQGKKFQNMAVFDPDPSRLEVWRRSLLGVSEQVIAAGTIRDLNQVLQNRLIDTVVLNINQELISAGDLASLKQISQRHQVVLFAPEVVSREMSLSAISFNTPVLLADLQDLPEAGSQFANQQLLIVDDNPTNLSFIRAMLDGQGISIDFAMTGEDALKMASHSRYRLILMDIQLPDLSGVEVTKRIRQLRHHQHTIIMAFTGHALPEEAASFRMAGMDDVMIKPLDARKIAHILTNIRQVAEIQ